MSTRSQTPYLSQKVPGVRRYEDALPAPLFDRIAKAVSEVGLERMKRNYTTTFWFPRDAEPSNLAERCVAELYRMVDPGPSCVGMEWWLGRLAFGQKLRMHFDRDMILRKKTGRFFHPIFGSVLYLNDFPGSPTVVLQQIAGPDGESRIPQKAEHRERVPAVANRYVVFPGNLRHGVVPRKETPPPTDPDALRLTLLVNYWTQRPMPPVCRDYDGSIYGSLRDA